MFKFLRFKHQIRKSIKTLKLQYLMQHTKVEIESNVHANKSNQISPLGWTLLVCLLLLICFLELKFFLF